MYGIFMECWVALKLYGGNGALLLMFLASAIYLVIAEKSLKKKIMLGIIPLLILAGFLFPVTKIAYVAAFEDGSDTYYRLMWLIQMYVVIGFAACRFIFYLKNSMAQRIAFVVMLVIIALSGSLVYASKHLTVAENLYHIPQHVIDICDEIAPEDGEPRVRAAFPSELVHFVRQYDTNILMPFGREIVAWDYYNVVYEVMEKPEVIDAAELVKATRETKCSYVILSEDRKIDGNLMDEGLELLTTMHGYRIYQDPVVIKELSEG